jgi:hypothetical protein
MRFRRSAGFARNENSRRMPSTCHPEVPGQKSAYPTCAPSRPPRLGRTIPYLGNTASPPTDAATEPVTARLNLSRAHARCANEANA